MGLKAKNGKLKCKSLSFKHFLLGRALFLVFVFKYLLCKQNLFIIIELRRQRAVKNPYLCISNYVNTLLLKLKMEPKKGKSLNVYFVTHKPFKFNHNHLKYV